MGCICFRGSTTNDRLCHLNGIFFINQLRSYFPAGSGCTFPMNFCGYYTYTIPQEANKHTLGKIRLDLLLNIYLTDGTYVCMYVKVGYYFLDSRSDIIRVLYVKSINWRFSRNCDANISLIREHLR